MHRVLARLLAAVVVAAAAIVGGSVAATPAAAADCGTSFAGFNGSVTQTYKSCWGNARVAPAYRTSSGAMHFFFEECKSVTHMGTVSWGHPYTLAGATYTTVFCSDFPIYEINLYRGGSLPPWTTFIPSSPQGRAMDHYYNNASNSGVWVVPAYHRSGTWYMDDTAAGMLYGWEAIRWRYSSTVTNVSYTTVFGVYVPDLS